MKKKKTVSANLENKRFIFFQIGIILSLSLALTAFEMKSYDETYIIFDPTEGDIIETEYSPITVIPKKPKPVPIPISVITAVPNDEPEIEQDDPFTDPFIGENTLIDNVVPEIPEEIIIEVEPPVSFVQDMPEFPGGHSALSKFLNKNMKYPIMAVETAIKGAVYIGFVVEKDGSITDIKLMRGIGGGCDEEAIRVVRMMPRWKPGKQFNRTVRVQYTLPVRFVLQ